MAQAARRLEAQMGSHVSSILFGDTMVPNIEQDSVLLLGYSILYKENNLTVFNHKKTLLM